ncbi:MAG: XdhC family protein [Papillibacter sp.]|jgi:xanthine dehydrogenase accessory factor|nr:XdhC family protein [Papillibacter sp.]
MNSIYLKAASLCAENKPFVWASIISQDGSTPRSAGTKMLVMEDDIYATVGGGAMEGNVIKTAREKVMKDRRPLILNYDLGATEAARTDFICGGCCEILLAYIEPDFRPVFEAAAEAEEKGLPAWLFYIIDENQDSTKPFSLCVNVDCQKLVGEYEGNSHFKRDMLLSPVRVAIHGDSADGIRYLVDDVGSAPKIFLFGGGHVSKELARLAVGAGFNVTVIDDREDYANTVRFPDCRCVVIDDFKNLPEFPVDENSYVVIMTRGHSYDRDVLRWALKHKYRYLGMIGSRSKRDTVYKALEKEGFSMAKMQQVKCPIGLTINAETPAEIAISIMAEIIAERRKK